MTLPALAYVPLAGDVTGALASVPDGPGVGQIAAAEGRNLVLGIASNLRRWAASHLGLGKKPPAGRRPKTDLSSIATAVGWVEIDAPFRQRLVYERLMAPLVPLSARRDLKPPAFLHLDPADRFPRVSVRAGETDTHLFGPFRDRRAAERARDALHRVFPLRSCDENFEPDPELPLGRACLHAQVRSCAAPCLVRIGEDGYRSLACQAAAWLADALQREEALPPFVSAAEACALVVDMGRETIGLVPVRHGRVLDVATRVVAPTDLATAVAALEWPHASGPDDWPWLVAWLRGAKARASYLLLREGEDRVGLAARVRSALPARFGDNLGATRGAD